MAETKAVLTDIKWAKAKILAVTDGDKWGLRDEPTKERPSYNIFVQDMAEGGETLTLNCSETKLPDNIVNGAEVDELEFQKREYGTQVSYRVKFRKADDSYKGKSSGGYGPSPEELSIRRFSEISKVVGVGYNYAAIILKESPGEITVEQFANTGDEIADRMWKKALAIKNQ